MTPQIPLWWYLIVAATLFGIGIFGALSRRNAVGALMGIELMLNAANLNAVAFWRYTEAAPGGGLARMDGQVFAIMVIALAAAEAAVGLALIISIYRRRQSVLLEDFSAMHG